MTPLLFAPLMCTCASCATYQRCADKYGESRTDTLLIPYEKLIPVAIVAPADSVDLKVNLSNIANAAKSNSNGMSIVITVDSATNTASIKAHMPPRVIRDTITLRDTVPVVISSLTLVKPPTLWSRLLSGYKDLAACGFIACLIIIYILIKAIRK